MASAQQKAARKKKRTSKHVLKAKEEREQQQQATAATQEEKPRNATKKNKKSKHVKDPSEAAQYLSSWKHRNAGGAWKFNKNTQSWLLRHLYQTELVSKTTFQLLLEYLTDLKGQMRTRTMEDAKRRALRYKEYEKEKESSDEKEQEQEASTKEVSEECEDDETRWKRLDDHEKRKEYKRARKVLETLKDE
jgi:hypothetical protein